MPVATLTKFPKKHVNLTLRADLYAVAQASAKAAGLSVSGLVENWLQALAKQKVDRPADEDRPDSILAGLRGILTEPLADLSKQEARALRHQARIGKEKA